MQVDDALVKAVSDDLLRRVENKHRPEDFAYWVSLLKISKLTDLPEEQRDQQLRAALVKLGVPFNRKAKAPNVELNAALIRSKCGWQKEQRQRRNWSALADGEGDADDGDDDWKDESEAESDCDRDA